MSESRLQQEAVNIPRAVFVDSRVFFVSLVQYFFLRGYKSIFSAGRLLQILDSNSTAQTQTSLSSRFSSTRKCGQNSPHFCDSPEVNFQASATVDGDTVEFRCIKLFHSCCLFSQNNPFPCISSITIIGGVHRRICSGRHLGRLSVDISVDISAGCRSRGGQVSVEYRPCFGRYVADSRPSIGRPSSRLSVDSRSMFGHYFADRSPTYHRHLVKVGSLFADVAVDTSVDCRSPNRSIHRQVLAEWRPSFVEYQPICGRQSPIGPWSVFTSPKVHRFVDRDVILDHSVGGHPL